MRTATVARILLAVLIAAAFSAPALANPSYWYGILWYDDMSEPTGWMTLDRTAAAVPHFHLDMYMAYDDPQHEEDVSWWCGTFDYDANGGYGNGWDDRLELPPVQIGNTVVEEMSWGVIKSLYRDEAVKERERDPRPDVLPVLSFMYRYDSEVGYDYTYVEAESLGVWRPLNNGFDGSSGGWQDIGTYGYVLSGYGDPVRLRFRFLSDGAWSDEDGLYLSDGGAFHVDNIRIFDFYGGETFFFDDMQGWSSQCVASVPGAAGDYWHLVDDVCSSNVVPSWWCGDDADTSLIPPNLQNSLVSPALDLSTGYTCTLRYALHAEVPTGDGDFWEISVFIGPEEYSLSSWWGDFEGCDGFGTSGLIGEPLDALMPATGPFHVVVTMYTSDNGCGPGAGGGAGINLDDTWIEGWFGSGGGLASSPYPESVRAATSRLRNTPYAVPVTPYKRL